MTNQTNASLIATAKAMREQLGEEPKSWSILALWFETADRLEAAEKRAEENRKEIDRLSRELQVAEDQANTIAGDLAQAERERDNWKLSAEEAERAEQRAEKRAEEAERERDRLDEAFDRDLPWRYDEVEAQRNQLAAVVEKVRAADSASSSWDHFGHLVMDILATAPDDALREHDAKVRAETLREAASRADEWRAANGMHGGEWFPSEWAGQVAGWLEHRADRIEREAGLK